MSDTNGQSPPIATAPPVEQVTEQVADSKPKTQSSGGVGKKLVGGFLLFGVVILLFRSCQSPGQPQQPIAYQVLPQSVESGDAGEQSPQSLEVVNQAVIRRNALLDEAIAKTNTAFETALCARKEYFRQQAKLYTEQTGYPVERWLLDRLNDNQSKLVDATVAERNFGGTPEQMAIARDRLFDQLALQQALQDHYQSKGLSLCVVAPADSLLETQQFRDQAQLTWMRSPDAQIETQAESEGTNDASSPVP